MRSNILGATAVSTVFDKTTTLALSLAQAERAIHDFTAGQLDAIVDVDGNAHLLRPAQEYLQRNERRLQAIIDCAADVITVVNRQGLIVSQNPAVRRVLGYSPGELIGKGFFELIHEGDVEQLHAAFFQVIEGRKESATVEFRHLLRDGSSCLIEATLGRILGGDEEACVILSLRSIDASRNARVALPLLDAVAVPVVRAKDRFLAMIAHELRTPLNPVLLGVAELEEEEQFAEARPVLAMMRRNLEVQTRLIEELTDFAMIGEHKVRLRLEAIDLHDALRFVLEICRCEITNAKIEIRLDLAATEPIVIADSVRLQQVMWNLLKNAIKFSPPGSTISIVTIDGPPEKITIAFTDEGIGIEPALLSQIFEPFQQGSLTEQRARGGLGLGLFIARGLTQIQGGTLTALSEGLGKGSTFRLTLPKAPADKPIAPMETDSQFFHPASHPLPS